MRLLAKLPAQVRFTLIVGGLHADRQNIRAHRALCRRRCQHIGSVAMRLFRILRGSFRNATLLGNSRQLTLAHDTCLRLSQCSQLGAFARLRRQQQALFAGGTLFGCTRCLVFGFGSRIRRIAQVNFIAFLRQRFRTAHLGGGGARRRRCGIRLFARKGGIDGAFDRIHALDCRLRRCQFAGSSRLRRRAQLLFVLLLRQRFITPRQIGFAIRGYRRFFRRRARAPPRLPRARRTHALPRGAQFSAPPVRAHPPAPATRSLVAPA